MLFIEKIDKKKHLKFKSEYLKILDYTYHKKIGHLLSAFSLVPIVNKIYKNENKKIFLKLFGIQVLTLLDDKDDLKFDDDSIPCNSRLEKYNIILPFNKCIVYFNEYFGALASILTFNKNLRNKIDIILGDSQIQIGEFYELLLYLEKNKIFNCNFYIDYNKYTISTENIFNFEILKNFNQNFYVYESEKGFFLNENEIKKFHWKILIDDDYKYLKNKLLEFK